MWQRRYDKVAGNREGSRPVVHKESRDQEDHERRENAEKNLIHMKRRAASQRQSGQDVEPLAQRGPRDRGRCLEAPSTGGTASARGRRPQEDMLPRRCAYVFRSKTFTLALSQRERGLDSSKKRYSSYSITERGHAVCRTFQRHLRCCESTEYSPLTS